MAVDIFRCPHEGCTFRLEEPCEPHTEYIGDQSAAAGEHCWEMHGCVEGHNGGTDLAWTHLERASC